MQRWRQRALARLETSLAAAAAERATRPRPPGPARDAELQPLRARARELAAELERLTDSVHRDEVARAEQRLRIEQLEARALEELGVDAGHAARRVRPRPARPAVTGGAGRRGRARRAEPGLPVRPRRAGEAAARPAERELALLGKVNPLALEEFAALEERHAFLTEQLEDLKKTRRDLLDIVKEVDERVEQVFTAAYDDTAREFERIFARLFPGGEGRLVLTDPTTCSPPASRSRPGRRARRSSGCRCCPAASGR